MNEVFEKTRELGEAIQRSDEYLTLKAAEAKAMKNTEAADAMGKYMELRRQMELMLAQGDKDWVKIQQVSDEMQAWQEHMNMVDDIIHLNQAQKAFSTLIDEVNSVLRFIVTGEMPSEDKGGCSGSCATCYGCGSKVN